ncbi:unnamed protein product [Orchesella dallaii]|uniref:Major facilitator superfamily (MFS) profile domain-containing protein n=1 Tax=Orchesella dallaii TaxID=48710 RepID=A0ABP1RLK8_9HEXA
MNKQENYLEERENKSLPKSSHIPQYLVCGILSLGGFLGGTVTGWSSTALPSIQSSNHFADITATDLSWIASITTLGCFTGCPTGGYFIRKFGRKNSLLFSSTPYLIGWVALTFPLQIWMLYFGRFLTGIGLGSMVLVGSVYLSEISEPKLRGRLSVIWFVAIRLGTIFAYGIGSILPYNELSAISGILSLLFGASTFFLPESPRWLVSKRRMKDAIDSLCWLQGCEKKSPSVKILEEIRMIEDAALKAEEENMVFEKTGSALNSHASGVLAGVAQLAGILLTACCVDKLGRKVLLLTAFIIMSVSLSILGAFQQFKTEMDNFSEDSGWIPLLSFMTYHAAYSGGPYVLAYTVASEVIPTNVIGSVSGLVTSIGWMTAFIFTRSYQNMNDSIGIANTFWIFALFSAIGAICIHFLIPETVGRPLENIHQERNNNNEDQNDKQRV